MFTSLARVMHVAAVPLLFAVLLGGCATGGAGTPAVKAFTAAPSATTTGSPSPGGPGSGTPSAASDLDPCVLLTKTMAEAAIYQQVGPPNMVHEGNALICAYNSISGPLPGILSASLTVYTGGKAALTEATNFYDLKPVPGVGDSAAIDVVTKVIVVSAGDLNFVISLDTGRICDDILDNPAGKAACWEDIKTGLIALARTVLQAR
jgi:hypothetical protein